MRLKSYSRGAARSAIALMALLLLRLPGSIHPGTTYHIVAQRNGGRSVVSQPITASNNDLMIDWDLQTNSMWFPTDNGS
jgi:hypothetical protein